MSAPTGTQVDDFDGLVLAWRTSIGDIRSVAVGLEARQWQTQTDCPGWSVADVVAHVIDAEATIAGTPRPEHQPDWSALPHVTGDFSRMTEVGVDARRGRPPSALLDELDAVIEVREQQLLSGPHDLDTHVAAFTASSLPLGRLLTMRTFDTWVHSQDIRNALGWPGGLQAPGAQVTAQLMVASLPRIWGKSVGAAVGCILSFDITGPGVVQQVVVQVLPDGRATQLPASPTAPEEADVRVRGTWPAVMRVMTGRIRPEELPESDLQIAGDPELASRLAQSLNIAP